MVETLSKSLPIKSAPLRNGTVGLVASACTTRIVKSTRILPVPQPPALASVEMMAAELGSRGAWLTSWVQMAPAGKYGAGGVIRPNRCARTREAKMWKAKPATISTIATIEMESVLLRRLMSAKYSCGLGVELPRDQVAGIPDLPERTARHEELVETDDSACIENEQRLGGSCEL